MTLNEIVTRAASAYPDCWVLQYWNMKKQCVVSNRYGGDSLAQFIAQELQDTYDPDASDDDQLDMAVRKMREAAADLQAIVLALANLKQERIDKAA